MVRYDQVGLRVDALVAVKRQRRRRWREKERRRDGEKERKREKGKEIKRDEERGKGGGVRARRCGVSLGDFVCRERGDMCDDTCDPRTRSVLRTIFLGSE